MSELREPRFETMRRAELRDEMIARAKVWLPDWRPRNGVIDFAGALFEIAARLESEVAQRLDKIPEKTFRGFLHWLGVRGQAGQAGRLPMVFGMAAGSEPVLASAPVQMQATPAQADSSIAPEPVTFETEQSVMLFPGSLAAVVGADPGLNRFYLPAAGFSTLEAPKPGPSDWTVKSGAAAGATQLQLEPALGLDALPTLLHKATKLQYRVTKAEGGLVTIEPSLGTPEEGTGPVPAAPLGLSAGEHLSASPYFDPFGDAERNRQEHALYIGSESALNLPADAQIRISGLSGDDLSWSYWGKAGNATTVDWQRLKPISGEPSLTLDKLAGSVEMKDIGGKTSRWLRATIAPNLVSGFRPASHLSLTLNCASDGGNAGCPPATRSNIAVEGIANTTPLVLDAAFYPLGREPRLFDAFYLGCPEAFSKKNASVRICLEALDGTARALTAARVGAGPEIMFFAIGADGNLHRLRQEADPAPLVKRLAAVRPPFTDDGIASVNTAPVALNRFQSRLSTVSRPSDTLVAATAGSEVWLWSQNRTPAQSRWFSLGPIPTASGAAAAPNDDPAVILMNNGANRPRVAALKDGELHEAVLPAGWETGTALTWNRIVLQGNLSKRTWRGIAPVFAKGANMTGAEFADGWIAFDEKGAVLFMSDNTNMSEYRRTLGTGAIEADVTPLTVRFTATDILVAAQKKPERVKAWRVPYDNTRAVVDLAYVNDTTVVGNSFDWTAGGPDDIGVVFARKSMTGAGGDLATWFPLAKKPPVAGTVADKSTLYVSQPLADLIGAPAVTADHAVAPGARDGLLATEFKATGLERTDIATGDLATALVFESALNPPVKDDFIEATLRGQAAELTRIATDPKVNPPNRVWLTVPRSKGAADVISARVYRRLVQNEFTGAFDTTSPLATVFDAEMGDHRATRLAMLAVHLTPGGPFSVHTIRAVVQNPGAPWTITVEPSITGAGAAFDVKYEYVEEITSPSALLPVLDQPPPGVVDALNANGAYFLDGEPSPNAVDFLQRPNPGAAVEAALLAEQWTDTPAKVAGNFILFTSTIFSAAVTLADTKTANPALSWEYFDGQAWWKIQGLTDGTSNLRSTGAVSFCVPPGLQPTDVAGRKSHWIRARLVGGDYGQEKVTVRTAPDPAVKDGTIQTVDRSLSGVTPPLLGSVDLRYSVCCATNPDYVITEDGGGTRDQTAANTIDAAKVELFMSLAESIRRASSGEPGAAGESGRAIYLGFDTPLSGGPISVLFLAEEGTHDAAYPLRVHVLRETGFEPVVAEDGTRGLNESGVLTFNLSGPPPAIALFGAARYWLRLQPSLRLKTTTPWQPRVYAAYLNAVFARASETQDLERLGSSDGSPGQRVFLARPPVLEGTLELRVREPLGEEEVEALQENNPDTVLDKLSNGQAGPWVKWTRVDDPDDGAVGERVYALNHDTGEITFGDGEHGRIPPIGRDSIVAIRYKRGGGDAANKVTAWSQINLISPVQGVERVVAPEGAAGGSDPQTAEEVIRFAPANQFMRDRALSLRDFEALALQSSRDVAQARALPGGTGMRLIVVMRGHHPEPTQAQSRELLRYLAERTSPMLAAEGAITIVEPLLVELRVRLTLTIVSIEHSGAVARDAKQRITSLLDPASGGLDKAGWRLADLPTDTDIAAVLDDVDHLEEIDEVEITAAIDGKIVTALQPAHLVTLAPEGISVQFQTANEEVPA